MNGAHMRSHFSLTLQPHGLQSARLLCLWDSPGKNTGVGYHFLFQGIFLTQGLNLHLLYWQVDSLPLNHLGIPVYKVSNDLFNSLMKGLSGW